MTPSHTPHTPKHPIMGVASVGHRGQFETAGLSCRSLLQESNRACRPPIQVQHKSAAQPSPSQHSDACKLSSMCHACGPLFDTETQRKRLTEYHEALLPHDQETDSRNTFQTSSSVNICKNIVITLACLRRAQRRKHQRKGRVMSRPPVKPYESTHSIYPAHAAAQNQNQNQNQSHCQRSILPASVTTSAAARSCCQAVCCCLSHPHTAG
jgi:hypothetical protein